MYFIEEVEGHPVVGELICSGFSVFCVWMQGKYKFVDCAFLKEHASYPGVLN